MNFFQKLKFRKELKKHVNRPLDINEILSRDTDTNVVVDAYEFFMRRCNWQIDDSFNDTIRTFLLCVLYDGEIANGGISQFLIRKSFTLFKDGIVPASEDDRNQMIDKMADADLAFEKLDIEAYNEDIHSLCYKYLLTNKDYFIK